MNKNLIAISGKKKSGKDTFGIVFNIISEYYKNKNEIPTTEYILIELNKIETDYKKRIESLKYFQQGVFFNFFTYYKIKQFSEKPKEIVSNLLSVNKHLLNDREFKQKQLDENWWYYESKYKKINYLEAKNTLINIENFELIKPTVNELLITIAEDLKKQNPNIWSNILLDNYKEESKGTISDCIDYYSNCNNCKERFFGYKYQKFCNKCILDNNFKIFPQWLITDLRFKNELEYIIKLDGIKIRINRIYNNLNNEEIKRLEHYTEKELDDYIYWDYIIENNSNLSDFIQEIIIVYKDIFSIK